MERVEPVNLKRRMPGVKDGKLDEVNMNLPVVLL